MALNWLTRVGCVQSLKKKTHTRTSLRQNVVGKKKSQTSQTKKRKEKRKLALMSGTSSIAMLSLTYTKEDRGVADQVYSNALIDGYMNMIVGYAPLVFSRGTHNKTTQTRKISGFHGYYERNINAPILENLIIAGRSRL